MKILNPKKRTQLSHITNLITMARIDGEISEQEKTIIFGIANQAGITDEEFKQCIKDSDEFTVDVPHSDEEKRQYLKNAITVMMADGNISQEEARFAFELANRFFGEKGENLVKELHQEILREMNDNTSDNKTMSQEEIKEEVKQRIENGLEWLKQNNIQNAFDMLFPAAIVDLTGRMLFMRIILPIYPLFQLNSRQINDLKGLADKGYPFAQLAMGRYHHLCRPERNSINMAEQYYQEAYKNGMPDAYAFLAVMVRDGALGISNENKYLEMRNEAYKKGSFKAMELIAKDTIYGNYSEPRPKEVLESLLEIATDEQGDWITDPLLVEPAVYDWIGKAYEQLGDKENAEKAYLQAAEMGFTESFGSYIITKFLDNELNVNDPELYAKHLEIGCSFNETLCYCLRGDMKEEQYNALPVELQPRMTTWMKQDLIKAYELGDNMAPYLLGNDYYFGKLGFEEDDEEAWKWFSRGALYSSSECYKMLAQMIEEGHCPDENFADNDNYLFYCKLCALRLGNNDMLIPVVRAYTNGMLTDFADEIEQFYLPKVKEEDLRGPLPGEEDEEEYDEEDGKYDAWS